MALGLRRMSAPHHTPSTVSHEHGEIIVDGPDGVAVSLTPEAALITAGRLETEAIDALLARTSATAGRPREV